MLRDEAYDVSEMSLSSYLIALAGGDRSFIALPVFPSRVFRHSYVWVRAQAGIDRPQDLKGKRVGIADYSMTALLFIRGFLQHQYGLPPQDVRWFRRRSEHVAIEIPSGIRIDAIAQDQTLDALLESGMLDALAVTSAPRAFVAGSPLVRRLFPDSRAVEAAYYRETKIFPIMHLIVMRRSLYEREPALARRLSEGFDAAKRAALEGYEEGLSLLPWAGLDLEDARDILGGDLLPYGVNNNLPTLEAATLYAYEQGLTKRKLAVKELFADETLDLFG